MTESETLTESLSNVATHKPKISSGGGGYGGVTVIVDDELDVVVTVGGRDKGTRCWIGSIGPDYLICITCFKHCHDLVRGTA